MTAKSEMVIRLLRAAQGRPATHRWLLEHHDELVGCSRIDWPEWARVMAEYGVHNGHGRPASPRTLRQTWVRVRKEVAASRQRQGVVRPQSTRQPVAQTPVSVPEAAVEGDLVAGLLEKFRKASGGHRMGTPPPIMEWEEK